MNTYLIFALLGFHSGYSAPPDPSVYEAIQLSKIDPSFRCPNLRKSKLVSSIGNIVDYCPSLKQVQSLEKINEKDIDNGLCILFYNNFEYLCYLTNNVSEPVPIDIPNFFEDDINLICKTLLKNTHFVNNSKPGIDAITHRLQSSCTRVCTDLDSKVKPICNLSALIYNVTAIFETTNKEAIAKPGILEVERVSGGLSNAKGPAQDISKSKVHSGAAKNVPLQENSDHININGLKSNTYLKDQSDAQAKLSSIKSNVPIQQMNITVDIPPILNPLLKQKLQQAKNIVDTKLMSTNGRDDQAQKNSAQAEHVNTLPINKIKDDAKSSNADVQQQVNLDINNQSKDSDKDTPNENTDVRTINSQSVPKASSIDVHSSEKDHLSTSVTKPSEQPNLQNGEISNIRKNKEPEGDVGNEGGMLQDTKEQVPDNDDFEMEEGLVPVDDGNTDGETVPKPSEVKSKTEVSKLTENLKPLQTDERYTISANYQNQNVDDSDSYFFSYFMMFCIIFICAYVAYHNKQKILALVIEGRKGRRPSRSRRPNSANYHKLDSNLEEAVTSTCNKGTPQVIY